MWSQHFQRTITEQTQKMFIKLCSEQVPLSGPLDIDGIVCITGRGPNNNNRQIVVKIHETVGKGHSGSKGQITEPDLSLEASSLLMQTQSGYMQREGPHMYTDTPSPNLPKDRLQSPEIPHDDNNTLSMSLKLEADSMDSESSPFGGSEHANGEDPDGHIHTSRTPIWTKQLASSTNSATVLKHQVLSSHLSSRQTPPSKIQGQTGSPASASAFNNSALKNTNSALTSAGNTPINSASKVSSLSNTPVPGGTPSTPNSSTFITSNDDSNSSSASNRTKVPISNENQAYEKASLSCKFCPGMFVGFKSLQSHLEEEHKRYLCKQCLSTFSMRCNLRRHERLHAGLKPYSCDQCTKSFARSTDLKIHLTKHSSSPTPSSLRCTTCTRVFCSTEQLSKHMSTQHKDKGDVLACHICNMLFQDPAEYDSHKRSHSDSLLKNGSLMNGVKMEQDDSMSNNDEVSDGGELPDSFKTPGDGKENNNKEEGEDSSSVQSVLQQLLFNSERNLKKRIQARNIIQMDTNEDGAFHTDEDASACDDQEKEANDEQHDYDEDSTALHIDTSENSFSTSSLSPPTVRHSSTPKKNRRKKGNPVRVICLEEQEENEDEESMFDDRYKMLEEGIDAEEEDENLPPVAMQLDSQEAMSLEKQGNFEFESQVDDGAAESLKHVESNKQSPQALDLSTPHTASNSLSMLQQLIPKPEMDRMSPPLPMPVLVLNKTELSLFNTGVRALPSKMPMLKPKPQPNITTSTPPTKVNKLKKPNSSPAPIDPDDLVPREYSCHYPGCNTKLTTFREYDEHSVSRHLRYPCKLCASSFTGRNNRTRHMRHHHGGSKAHVCSDCGKHFARSDSLREHQYIHTKSYHDQKCHNCGVRCEKKVLLLAHLKKCYGKTRTSKGTTPSRELSPLPSVAAQTENGH